MADRNAAEPADSRMEFRIGINMGDVVVENDDIFGDGVNVAARLEGLADPGSICKATSGGCVSTITASCGCNRFRSVGARLPALSTAAMVNQYDERD